MTSFTLLKNNNSQKLFAGLIALVLVAGMTSPAYAGVPVPPMCENTMPPIGASESIGPGIQQDVFHCDDLATWYIGSDPLPQVVIADPAAGPWIKNLQPPLLGLDSLEPQIPSGFEPGFRDILVERIEVGPGLAWTDWHEQIISPGWSFDTIDVIVINPDGSPNFNFIIAPPNPDSVWIDFVPPLEPGSRLIIQKDVQYDGPPTDSPLQINEWPTFVEDEPTLECEIFPTSANVEVAEVDGSGFVDKEITCNFAIEDFVIFENDCAPYEVGILNPDFPNPGGVTFTEQVTSFASIDPQHCLVTFEVVETSGEVIFLEQELWINMPDNEPIGGTVGSMSTTSLLVAGAQSDMGLWSLALVGIVGAAAAITYKVKSKSEQ